MTIDTTKRELCGTLRKVIFADEDTGAIICAVNVNGANGSAQAEAIMRGECEPGELEPGSAYRFFGRWQNHYKHGPQFLFQTFCNDQPHGRQGVITYLAREAPHVGLATAKKLWDAYGSTAIETLRTRPAEVSTTGILTLDQAREAAEALAALAKFEKTKIDLFELFAGRGFTKRTIAAAITKWGVRAAERIRRDPFVMLTADIPGGGFKRCDKLFIDLGNNPGRLKRQMLAAWAALRDETDGDTWMIEGAARAAIVRTCGASRARLDAAITLGVRTRRIAERRDDTGKRWIAEHAKAMAERTVAQHVKRLLASRPVLWPVEQILADPLLSDHQRDIVRTILASPLCILAGTPGTGKTYTAAAILRAVVQTYGQSAVSVCAPTGKAAVRITEAMHRNHVKIEATTIHRLLEIGRNGHDGQGWGFMRNAGRPLDQRFIVLDETSMMDTTLAADLLQAAVAGAHVLCVGDPFQLPPVGHGAPLRDMIAGGVPYGLLTEIKRQNPGLIVKGCTAIKDGQLLTTCKSYDPEAGADLMAMECDAEQQWPAIERILNGIRNSTAKRWNATWDVQVLVARNDERHRLNKELQGLLNPPTPGSVVTGSQYRVGDKLICLRNCMLALHGLTHDLADPRRVDSYETASDFAGQPIQAFLANGDIGRVEAVEPRVIVAKFASPTRVVKIPMGKPRDDEKDKNAREARGGDESRDDGGGSSRDFDLAYAITCHKSQGSEWPVVIVVVDEGGGMVTSREWHYTAISRAAQLCVLIGKRSVLARQCRRVNLGKRKTFLTELLKEHA